jgi:uncharacterized membrane protein YfcA
MSVQLVLHVGLAVVAIVIIAALARAVPLHHKGWPKPIETAIGFVTNFFDTLGIGSFAPTTSMFKLWRLVPDERIPGTLNVGHTLPTIVEAAIYITIISVVPLTLVLLIAAAVVGAWLGAGIVSKLPRQYVQIGMGVALLAAATLFILSNLRGSYFGLTGDALGLTGTRLVVGVVVSFFLGALMTIGIGMYAPCMILVSLLGMNPKAAFPIMMGSCAFLMPIASLRFIRYQAFSMRAALGLALGGIPGVLIAAYIVKSLPLAAVRWLVVVVVLYAAAAMLRSAARHRASTEDEPAAVPEQAVPPSI